MKPARRTVKPSSPEASKRLAKVRQAGTSAEMRLRRVLHSRGLRYRVGVTLIRRPRRVVDIVFRPKKVAVFVDGCFWHGCPEHGTSSKSNADFWREKIETNKRRDADTDRRLLEAGWTVIRVWEHEDPELAADQICEALEVHK